MKLFFSFFSLLIVLNSLEAEWSDPIQISLSGPNSTPKVAVDSLGNGVIIWINGSGSQSQIQYATYISGSWSAPAPLTDYGIYQKIRIAVDSAGHATAAWENAQKGSIESASMPFGGEWSAIETLSEGTQNIYPKLAIDDLGNAMVIWINTLSDTVFYSMKTNLTNWSLLQPLFSGGHTLTIDLQMTSLGNGLAVRFADQSGVLESQYYSNGAWGSSQIIAQNLKNNFVGPQAALNIIGDAICIWVPSDNYKVMTATRPVEGVWSTPEIISDDQPNTFPSDDITTEGHAIAIWINNDQNIIQAASYMNLFLEEGGWAAPVTISDGIGYQFATFFCDDSGNGTAIWQYLEGGVIQVVNVTSGVNWSSPPISISHSGYNSFPYIDGNIAGARVAVWVSDNGTDTVVQAAIQTGV